MSTHDILNEQPVFTQVEPGTARQRLWIFRPQGRNITVNNTVFDPHQLVEFGAFALGNLDDADSVVELLDGYGFNQEQLNEVAEKFREIADVLYEPAFVDLEDLVKNLEVPLDNGGSLELDGENIRYLDSDGNCVDIIEPSDEKYDQYIKQFKR